MTKPILESVSQPTEGSSTQTHPNRGFLFQCSPVPMTHWFPQKHSFKIQALPNDLTFVSGAATGFHYPAEPLPFNLSSEPNLTSDLNIFGRFKLEIQLLWPGQVGAKSFLEKATLKISEIMKTQQIKFLRVFSPNEGQIGLSKTLESNILTQVPNSSAEVNMTDTMPDTSVFWIMIHGKCLWAGAGTPSETGNFVPGGLGFLRRSQQSVPSRAGNKILESLECAAFHEKHLAQGFTVLELGAAPGGMTSELLNRGLIVTAIDRAPLSPMQGITKNLTFLQQDVFCTLPGSQNFQAIVCDMNGASSTARKAVHFHTKLLNQGGLLFFTLKLESWDSWRDQLMNATLEFEQSGYHLLTCRHLFTNRQELFLLLQKK